VHDLRSRPVNRSSRIDVHHRRDWRLCGHHIDRPAGLARLGPSMQAHGRAIPPCSSARVVPLHRDVLRRAGSPTRRRRRCSAATSVFPWTACALARRSAVPERVEFEMVQARAPPGSRRRMITDLGSYSPRVDHSTHWLKAMASRCVSTMPKVRPESGCPSTVWGRLGVSYTSVCPPGAAVTDRYPHTNGHAHRSA
jgi:hypothetical protein